MCFESKNITSAMNNGMTLGLILDNEWINSNKDAKLKANAFISWILNKTIHHNKFKSKGT